MRGDVGTASTFFSMAGQCGGETISAGLRGKGYLDCLPQEHDRLVA